jgi:molybdopterin molybdotransferase/putative molybdopterin biosynthesis protein
VEWEGTSPFLEKAVVRLQNIRRRGEDFESGALLIPQDIRLQPQDLSLLLAAGHEEIKVYQKPRVAFLPTGSELVLHTSEYGNGKVLESNSAMVAEMVKDWGGEFLLADPVEDEPEVLAKRIQDLTAQCDILVISAGTSMGVHDHTSAVLEKLGRIRFHGVALHPARPVILADVSTIPVLGLPGYPVAAFIACYVYLRPLMLALSKIDWKLKQDVFISAEDIPAKDTDYFYRVHLYDVDGRVFAKRILRGAGSILSLSQMDGLMHVPPAVDIHKRDGVRVDIVNERWQNSFAVQGIPDPNVFHLFELFRQSLPSSRILFWDASVNESLQAIIERNAHMAIIAVEEDSDPFPGYATQLQEPMLRFRIFTRDSRTHYDLVVLESHSTLKSIRQLIDLMRSSEFLNYLHSQDGCQASSSSTPFF